MATTNNEEEEEQTDTIMKDSDPVKSEPPSSPELARAAKNVPPISQPSNESAPIKIEDPPTTNTTTTNTTTSTNNINNPAIRSWTGPDMASGLVGKLRIHASGKATIDWGGTSLQMGMGQDAQFLQDVLVVRMFEDQIKTNEEDEDKDKGTEEGGGDSATIGMNGAGAGVENGGIGGEALGLGQVRGKFVVTPNWEEIL